MRGLKIGAGLELPLEWVTLATVVYGARGAGKTTWASVACEECHAAGQRFVVVDPKGDYWGLKSTADGAGEGLPVVIFGGDHADLPLTEQMGSAIADLVVEMDLSAVLDLERLRKGAQIRFLAAFFERLYEQNRENLLVVLDEAQRYAPQNVRDAQKSEGYATRCLGAIEDVVKLGRKHGLGIVLVTQRGAGLNKECSELCDMMVAFRTPGTLDQQREKEWLGANATAEQAKRALEVVSGLDTGTAVVASNHPGCRVFDIVPSRLRRTFDSSATPRPGERRRTASMLAAVDVAAIAERLEALAEPNEAPAGKATAAATAKLTARVADLERRSESDAALIEQVAVALAGIAAAASGIVASADAAWDGIEEALRGRDRGQDVPGGGPAGDGARPVADRAGPDRAAERADPPRGRDQGGTSVPRPAPPEVEPAATGRVGSLVAVRKADRATMDVLAWAHSVGLAPLDRDALAVLAGASPSSGAYSQKLARLRDEGLLEYPSPGAVAASRTYLSAAFAGPGPSTSDDLQASILGRLPGALSAVLTELLKHRDGIGRDDLAAALGRSTTSGAYSQNLAALVRLGVAYYPRPGTIAPTSVLWLPDDRRG